MLGNTRVEDDDLKALALRRATAVQSALARQVPGASSDEDDWRRLLPGDFPLKLQPTHAGQLQI